jgi:hypothetical protein
MNGWADTRQISKIRLMIEEYDSYVTKAMMYAEKETGYYELIIQKTRELQESIATMKISAVTMNRLIGTCLGVIGKANTNTQYDEASKYISRTFNLMYQTDKEKFLRNFKRSN